jgi:hypothetical protein
MKQLTIIIIIILTALTSCAPRSTHQLDTQSLIGERESLTHLRMLDGNTGQTRVFVPGPELNAALDFVAMLEPQRETEQEPRSGYLYWLAAYRNGEEAFRLQFGGEVINVDGVQYRADQTLAEELDALWDSASYGGLVDLAMTDLAANLDLSVDQVTPQAVEAYTFPDTSLGLPQAGMMYAQVLTPGYIITLEADGQTYTYHGADETIVRAE